MRCLYAAGVVCMGLRYWERVTCVCFAILIFLPLSRHWDTQDSVGACLGGSSDARFDGKGEARQ